MIAINSSLVLILNELNVNRQSNVNAVYTGLIFFIRIKLSLHEISQAKLHIISPLYILTLYNPSKRERVLVKRLPSVTCHALNTILNKTSTWLSIVDIIIDTILNDTDDL